MSWKARNDPTVNVAQLVANGTRIWIYCGNGTPGDPALASPNAPIAGLGFLEGFAIDSDIAFRDAYLAAGGNSGAFVGRSSDERLVAKQEDRRQAQPARNQDRRHQDHLVEFLVVECVTGDASEQHPPKDVVP